MTEGGMVVDKMTEGGMVVDKMTEGETVDSKGVYPTVSSPTKGDGGYPSLSQTPSNDPKVDDYVATVQRKSFSQENMVSQEVLQLSSSERAARIVTALADKSPDKIASIIVKLGPVLGGLFTAIDVITPYAIKGVELFTKVQETVPQEGFLALVGLLMCFFGGHFPVLIAAAEAFYLCGFQQSQDAFYAIYQEFQQFKEQDAIDNKKDDDGDGIADVDQISPSALLIRKVNLFMMTTKDPERLSRAFGSLGVAFAGVIATLKVQFAKTIALGATIGDMMTGPAERHGLPVLKLIVPPAYHKWNIVGINFVCKFIAISLAWTLSRIISSVQSAIRGGLMFSRNIILLLVKYKKIAPVDLDNTYMDEAIGWSLALFGFTWQFFSWYSLSFPFNLILFPVNAMETYLRWYIQD